MIVNILKDFVILDPAQRLERILQDLHQLLGVPQEEWPTHLKMHNERVRMMGKSEWCIHPKITRIAPIINLHKDLHKVLHEIYPNIESKSSLRLDSDEESHTKIDWWVWAHNMRSGHNLGSIIRTVDCMGWKGVYTSGYTSDPNHKKVAEAAMGAEKWVDVKQVSDTDELFKQDVYALETSSTAHQLDTFKWPSMGILLLGNEELGVHPEWMEKCKGIIEITQFGRKASLNVANAFAISAFTSRTNIK
jgi:tRNA G18 (ribose-2'-O)-methylase SpoU